MEIDNNMLIMGGIVVVGLAIGIYLLSPTMFGDIKYGIMKIFNPNLQDPLEPLSSDQEEEQASLYSSYY